jgi:hypothetical protein
VSHDDLLFTGYRLTRGRPHCLARCLSSSFSPLAGRPVSRALDPLPSQRGTAPCRTGRTAMVKMSRSAHATGSARRPQAARSPVRFKHFDFAMRPRHAEKSRGQQRTGGTGLEPVTPSLSIWSDRSRQFAQVRSSRTVERDLLRDRTLERARTNADPCQSCHARWDLHAASIPLLRVVHHLPMNTAAHGAQRLVRICIKRRRTGTCSCWRRAVLQPTVRSACEWVSRSAGCDDVARSSAARKCSPSAAFSALRFARREPR